MSPTRANAATDTRITSNATIAAASLATAWTDQRIAVTAAAMMAALAPPPTWAILLGLWRRIPAVYHDLLRFYEGCSTEKKEHHSHSNPDLPQHCDFLPLRDEPVMRVLCLGSKRFQSPPARFSGWSKMPRSKMPQRDP
jgi:hypothetical protein